MIVAMLFAAIIGVFIYSNPTKNINGKKLFSIAAPLAFAPLLLSLFMFFIKVGSFIYGGGLVVIPFIENEVVNKLGWLTQTEFLAGIALGQLTPGPVVITACVGISGILGSILTLI
ncbi:chromate transporter [Clostridium lacusfryxellense]|uniref:chromate transporter n=1 Tax=Clostridium lacusfryxellense TaxID=205328 RepID=UPI0035E45C64